MKIYTDEENIEYLRKCILLEQENGNRCIGSGMPQTICHYIDNLKAENELLENSVLTLDEKNAELISVLKLAKESIEFHTKPLCMCFAGCDECQPNPQPDSIYEVLETIKEVLGE